MIGVKKLTGTIGAEISGVDLSAPLDEAEVAAIRAALFENLVVFFRGQPILDDDQHIRLGRYFGTLDISDVQPKPHARPEILILDQMTGSGAADKWHRDRTYLEAPPMGSILQCVLRPPVGGDTCWASMYRAYDTLSEPIRTLVDGLSALHSIEPLAQASQIVADAIGDRRATWPTAIHPLVEVHPETGRKALNVNANWTARIVGLSKEESDMLLGFLLDHVKRTDFHVRFTWNEGDVAFWDNRAAQHCAVADYASRRIMRRVAIVGHKPRGPQAAPLAA